jgi:RNA polymerase sigma-70 factor (ECF subfamily)
VKAAISGGCNSLFFLTKKKDSQVFEQAALEHLDALYGTALKMTGQVAEAEDLVQDTYLRAIRFRRKFQPGTNLKAWLFKMMVNLFINRYRRNRRSREIHEGAERHEMAERLFPSSQMLSTSRPEEYFFEKLFSDDVVAALNELPHDFKMAVLLVDVNDFSYAQVAEILGIPVGTVMSRLHRGRRLLQGALHAFAVSEGYVKEPQETEQPSDLNSYREKKRLGKKT